MVTSIQIVQKRQEVTRNCQKIQGLKEREIKLIGND